MSYLDVPRLNFSGGFAADPSTVDNNRDNFVLGAPLSNDPNSPNWVLWNPMGSHVFQFLGCTVRSAVLQDGPAPPADAIVGAGLEWEGACGGDDRSGVRGRAGPIRRRSAALVSPAGEPAQPAVWGRPSQVGPGPGQADARPGQLCPDATGHGSD
ncbi:MAG: hypothetical protein ACHRXM_18160, partial [Isosphaerales bacterium]